MREASAGESADIAIKMGADMPQFVDDCLEFFAECQILEPGHIESDDIVTKNIDKLFEECKRIKNYPLCPIHPNDPNGPIQNLIGWSYVPNNVQFFPIGGGNSLGIWACSKTLMDIPYIFTSDWHHIVWT